ncbi:MAG TPA: kelch repeat-containing protein [Acidimicrobiales bacterium]|nr:kelch repeat-containing protein [Acidimicrobiales bacterium]
MTVHSPGPLPRDAGMSVPRAASTPPAPGAGSTSGAASGPGAGPTSGAGARRARRRAGSSASLLAGLLAGGATFAMLGAQALPASATTSGAFAATGSLNVVRADATATLLPDGDVLVAGGQDSSGTPLASAELYSASAGAWSVVPSLPVAVTEATATLLPDGDVLVAGGLSEVSGSLQATTDAELYNPTSDAWSSTGAMVAGTGSYGASAVLLPASGEVLYAGGFAGTGSSTSTLADSQLYNPTSGTWAVTVGQPTLGVADAAASLLGNSEVLLAGGESQSSGGSPAVTSTTELFQPATGMWSAAAAMPVGVAGATATALQNGDVLVAGGESSAGGLATSASQVYDPSSASWSSAGSLPTASFGATAALMASGDVLYAGGLTASSGDPTTSAAVFDPTSSQWTATGSMLVARGDAAGAALANGSVLVAGGEGVSGVTGDAEVYSTSVSAVPAAITSSSSVDIQAGVSAKIVITTTGSPTPTLTESGNLPPGLTFQAASGTATISGTPQTSSTASYKVTIVATNGSGSPAVQQLTLRYTRPAAITTKATIPAKVGVSLDWTVRASGVPTPTLSVVGTLPAGLSFTAGKAAGTGVFSGTPLASAAGDHQVSLEATNGIGTVAKQSLSIDVASAPSVAVASGVGYWSATSTGQLVTGGSAKAIAPATPQYPSDVVAMAATPDHGGYYLVSSFGGVFDYGDAHFYGSLSHEHLTSPIVAVALTPTGQGYYLVSQSGVVYTFGNAKFFGDPAALHPAPVVGFGLYPGDDGYWVVTDKGNVYDYGAAHWEGSTAHQTVPPITAFAPTADGKGYWLVSAKGNVYGYGDARYLGSLDDQSATVVAFAPTLDGKGYWLVTAKGSVFNFGDAQYFGPPGTLPTSIIAFSPEF